MCGGGAVPLHHRKRNVDPRRQRLLQLEVHYQHIRSAIREQRLRRGQRDDDEEPPELQPPRGRGPRCVTASMAGAVSL